MEMESKLSQIKVNNEYELCRVSDLDVKSRIEKVLLAARISYYIRWDKAGFFSSSKKEGCVFCVNEWQVEDAENAIMTLSAEDTGKVKFIRKKVGKTLF